MATAIKTFVPSDDQKRAMFSLYIHIHHVTHNGVERRFGLHAEECDRLEIPFWVQNNLASMADERQVYFKNGEHRILRAACHLDWRPHVARGQQ